MTNFLDAQLASSKTLRKERQQAARPSESDATARAFATFQRAVGRGFRKADNQEKLIAKAIADTMPEFIAAMDDEVLTPFFFSLERLATAANRRRIASHPLRPEAVDELHEDEDAKDERIAEQERKAAEAAERDAKTAKATPQGAPESASAP